MNTYYKVIRDGAVIDVGFAFVRVSIRDRAIYCDADHAMLLQGAVSGTFYHVGWLLKVPVGTAVQYEEADASVIDLAEYDELYEQLVDGEPVPEPTPEPEPTPSPEPEPEPEHKMTVQEMREKIAEQDETISMLTECLLEMSEIVYGGEL